MEENKAILELLQKIEKSNRQQANLTRLMCIFALISAICCVCVFGLVYTLLPQITEIIPQINTVASQMQTVLSDLEQATRQLSVMDFTGMVEGVNTLVATGQAGLAETVNKLNSIDFEALNKAIDTLTQVIDPLAKFFKVFG